MKEASWQSVLDHGTWVRCRQSALSLEDGITGEGPLNVDTLLLSRQDSSSDMVNILVSKRTIFSIVWVQGADSEPG